MGLEKQTQKLNKEKGTEMLGALEQMSKWITETAKAFYTYLEGQKAKDIKAKTVLDKTKSPESKDPITKHIHEKTKTAPTLNNIKLYTEGPKAFAALSRSIQAAKRKIQINMFSWAPDSTGLKLTKDLETVLKQSKGLKIDIRLDRMGMFFVANKKQDWMALLGRLQKLKLEKKKKDELMTILGNAFFNPRSVFSLTKAQKKLVNEAFSKMVTDKLIMGGNKAFQALVKLKKMYPDRFNIKIENNSLGNADHSKVVIVDDVTYTGGMNFGDDYSGGYSAQGGFDGTVKPKYWKDYMMRFDQGPATALYRNIFFHLKTTPVKELKELVVKWAQKAKENPQAFSNVTLLHNKGGEVSSEKKAAHEKQITYAIQHLLKKAKKEVLIEHAYLQDQNIIDLIKKAAKKGVKVKIVRSKPESQKLEAMNEHFFKQLKGVKNVSVYQYGNVTHTKSLVVDGKYSVIGSCNLSAASLRYHEETSLYTSGKNPFNTTVRQSILSAIKKSRLSS